MPLPPGTRLASPFHWEEYLPASEQLPSDTTLTIVHWQDGVWGGGFEFDVIREPEQFQKLAADRREIPRSDRVIIVSIGEGDNPLGYVEISNAPDFVDTIEVVAAHMPKGPRAAGVQVLPPSADHVSHITGSQ